MGLTERYNMGKLLETQLLDLLNTKQPFNFYDTYANTELPLVPYYSSLYRYSPFDIYNDYTTFELKSRTLPKTECINNLLDTNKVISNHSIFLFSYNNPVGVFEDLQYIQYNKTIFDSLQIQQTRNGAEIYIIPNYTEGFTALPNDVTTHSHRINIHYTEDYKEQHTMLISVDKTKYISTFGYYSLIT
jgi:hypothetical protein